MLLEKLTKAECWFLFLTYIFRTISMVVINQLSRSLISLQLAITYSSKPLETLLLVSVINLIGVILLLLK